MLKSKLDQRDQISSVLRFLSIRPRSQQEVRRYLEAKISDREQISKIIDRLVSSRLLDDKEFSSWLVSSRSRTRPRSVFLLKKELTSFGVSPEIISDTLSSQDDVLQAQNLLSRKIDTWSHLSRLQFRRKAYNLLSRKGFSSSVIETVLKKVYNILDVN